VSLALERPFEACEARYETCRVSPTTEPAACQDSMRNCLREVATWMQQSRALIEKCREQAAQCRISQPTQALSCNDQFESCVAPAFQPGASSDDDAGVPDQDAGATTTPSTPTEGAAGSISPPPVAGSGGSAGGEAPTTPPTTPPGLPPTLPMPGSATASDACRSELLECLTPSADLAACATRARECLRSNLLPTL
jgi:hypothetical protein